MIKNINLLIFIKNDTNEIVEITAVFSTEKF